jgi:hypothetical protein
MSGNWQLYASFVWSRSRGTIGDDFLGTSGFSPAAASPNYFVNLSDHSRTALDRPTVARLMGTYRFPLGFSLSFLFVHVGGAPWSRSVTVSPPAAWVEKNGVSPTEVTVLLEEPGARRYPSYETLDLRVERDFMMGKKTRMHVHLDVLNLLGEKAGLLDLNDGGYWFPESENSSKGKRILSGTYEKFLSARGTRVVQLGLGLKF